MPIRAWRQAGPPPLELHEGEVTRIQKDRSRSIHGRDGRVGPRHCMGRDFHPAGDRNLTSLPAMEFSNPGRALRLLIAGDEPINSLRRLRDLEKSDINFEMDVVSDHE